MQIGCYGLCKPEKVEFIKLGWWKLVVEMLSMVPDRFVLVKLKTNNKKRLNV